MTCIDTRFTSLSRAILWRPGFILGSAVCARYQRRGGSGSPLADPFEQCEYLSATCSPSATGRQRRPTP